MKGVVVKSITFSPIGPWPLLVFAALAVMALTIWAYHQRLKGTTGRWRWLALGLRLAAVLLCLLATVRPSIIFMEKVKQAATLIFLEDFSTSMAITDEVRNQSRFEVAQKGMESARETVKRLGPNIDAKFYHYGATVEEIKPDDARKPDGKQTAIGNALMDVLKRQNGGRIASIVLIGDGANNAGLAPLSAAQRLASQQVPVIPVGVGSETAGVASRDIAARELVAGPTVFVKNELQVRGTLNVRGYPNEQLDVELLVEGQSEPVATAKVKAPEGSEVVPIRGLKYTPRTPGEKLVTLRVKPKEGELVRSNNEISTFVTVLSGGLNVLYLLGPGFSWEAKYTPRALDESQDIQVDWKVLRRPVREDPSILSDADFAPGRYDVYVLSNLPADYLTPQQQRLLTLDVEKGAGLMMLGGRFSFGPGGWAGTSLGDILPIFIHPGDSQMEPKDGIKVIPQTDALDNYVLRLGPTRKESARIWSELPPIPGATRFGKPKARAIVLAESPERDPLMVVQDVSAGRVLAFAGETWVWYRSNEESQAAHRKFWRQAIFWLAHKEDKGESQVKLTLEKRRLATGEKLDMRVIARTAKNEPITDAKFETTVVRIKPDGKPEPVELYNQGDEARGSYFASNGPGEYRVTVSATQNGKDIGSDTARFLVYEDDRELENPAADHGLLRQIAEITSGKFLTPEQLGKHLRSLDSKDFTDYVSQKERKIWDNWPFFLIFVLLLTVEWWLRKKNGWV